jgi:hypothetical protein
LIRTVVRLPQTQASISRTTRFDGSDATAWFEPAGASEIE